MAQAGDGDEAIRLAGALRPDLAVLDLAMPGIGGIEAAAAIRERSPRTRIAALPMASILTREAPEAGVAPLADRQACRDPRAGGFLV